MSGSIADDVCYKAAPPHELAREGVEIRIAIALPRCQPDAARQTRCATIACTQSDDARGLCEASGALYAQCSLPSVTFAGSSNGDEVVRLGRTLEENLPALLYAEFALAKRLAGQTEALVGASARLTSELGEMTITLRIVARATLVVAAVELDDESNSGASEVDDEGTDDELPPKRESRLRAGKTTPQPLLGPRGRESHLPSALIEELRLLLRNEFPTKHADLHVGRRIRAPSEGPERRFRDARIVCRLQVARRWRRAARNVRAPQLGARMRRPVGVRWAGFRAEWCRRGAILHGAIVHRVNDVLRAIIHCENDPRERVPSAKTSSPIRAQARSAEHG
jgi:hypothetical protein